MRLDPNTRRPNSTSPGKMFKVIDKFCSTNDPMSKEAHSIITRPMKREKSRKITETIVILAVIGTHERKIVVRTRRTKQTNLNIVNNPMVLVQKIHANMSSIKNASKMLIRNTIKTGAPTISTKLREAQEEVVDEAVDEEMIDLRKLLQISSNRRLQTAHILRSQDGSSMYLKMMSSCQI